jgi:hypothetical protein
MLSRVQDTHARILIYLTFLTNDMNRIAFILLLVLIANSLVAQPETRPDDNTGIGFFVKAGKLYDANGIEFIPYGANSVHVWLNEANSKNALRNEMPKAHINTVRLVTAGESWTWNNQSETPAKKKALAQLAIDADMIPMLELHDGTCLSDIDKSPADGKMGLKQIIDHWLLPENISMLKELEKYLMLNIANEWGPDADADNKEDFLIGYKDAITRLRNAGVKNVLVIDAGGCGQDPRTLLQYADALLAYDPQHNIVASIHLYGLWRSKEKIFSGWIPPYVVEDDLPKLAALQTPVLVGEFGWTDAGTSINFNPEIVIQTCYANKLGWLFWAWHSNDTEPFFNITARADLKYSSVNDLSNAGKFMVNDAQYGFKHLAARATVFPEFITATENKALDINMQLYPNPMQSVITLTGSDVTFNTYHILNVQGSLCAEGFISKSDSEINVSHLPEGIYVVRIYVANQYITFKIEKKP